MSKRRNSTPRDAASCFASSVLPTPVGSGEQEGADGLVGRAEAGARQPDGRRHRGDRVVLAEHEQLQIAVEGLQPLAVRRRHLARRDARHGGDDVLDVVACRRWSSVASGFTCAAAPASSMTSIALSGRKPVVDVLGRQLGRGAQRVVGVGDAVMLLVVPLEPVQDLVRLVDARLGDARSSGSGGRARDRARSAACSPGRSWRRCSAARRVASAGFSRFDASMRAAVRRARRRRRCGSRR